MPDLSAKGSHAYWKQFQDPMIYRVITFMESVEKWIHEGNPQVEQAMDKLGQELDDFSSVDMNKLAQQPLFIRIANHLGMPRTLRLLQAIDTSQPGSAARLLMHAEEIYNNSRNEEADLFLRRNMAFERLRLLARVFSTSRLEFVLKALESD
jgi:intracellular multiplication protein IcmW